MRTKGLRHLKIFQDHTGNRTRDRPLVLWRIASTASPLAPLTYERKNNSVSLKAPQFEDAWKKKHVAPCIFKLSITRS